MLVTPSPPFHTRECTLLNNTHKQHTQHSNTHVQIQIQDRMPGVCMKIPSPPPRATVMTMITRTVTMITTMRIVIMTTESVTMMTETVSL